MDNPVIDRAVSGVSLPSIPRHPSWFGVFLAVGVAFTAVDVAQTWTHWYMEMSPLWVTFGFEAFVAFSVFEVVLYALVWRGVRGTRWRRAVLAYVAVWALWQGVVAAWNMAVIAGAV